MAYPVSTGGSDQWQTSDGNKHDSMGAAQIAQDNIDSGKNMSFTNQQSSSGPKSLFDDPAYLEKHRKDMEEIRKSGNAVVDAHSRKLDSILDKYYRTVQKLHIEGNDFFRKQNWNGAIEALTKALSIYTSNQFEKFKKELFDHAHHVNKYWNKNSSKSEKLEDCPEYDFAETAIKTWQNDMERCREWLEMAKKNSVLFTKADELCGQGNRFKGQGNLDQAISCFSQAISYSGEWKAYCQRGRCYEEQGNIDQAIADFNSAIDSAVKKFGEITRADFMYQELYGNRDRLIEKAEQIKPIEERIVSLIRDGKAQSAFDVEKPKWEEIVGREMTNEDLDRIFGKK